MPALSFWVAVLSAEGFISPDALATWIAWNLYFFRKYFSKRKLEQNFQLVIIFSTFRFFLKNNNNKNLQLAEQRLNRFLIHSFSRFGIVGLKLTGQIVDFVGESSEFLLERLGLIVGSPNDFQNVRVLTVDLLAFLCNRVGEIWNFKFVYNFTIFCSSYFFMLFLPTF